MSFKWSIHPLFIEWKPCVYRLLLGKVLFSVNRQGKPILFPLHHPPRRNPTHPVILLCCCSGNQHPSESFDSSGKGKVFRFGAWLDDDIAGDGIWQCEQVCSNIDSTLTRQQKAYSFFCYGVKEFDGGCYDAAVNWFQKAAAYGDPSSRTGGQYQLWTAQALHAAGKRDNAKSTLQKLKYHKDRDVRKASQQLLYILGAPQLKLDDSYFVCIPTARVPVTKNKEKRVAAGYSGIYNMADFGKDRYAFIQKAPEKYSLEWFVQKPPPPPKTSYMNMNLVVTLATTIIVCMLVFFYHG
ncbi:hypothetical protein GpartN1_g3893.t1 [Galdieria partita]|uniref:Uncharacterized protein n=1 Tax=Galdieria partita TaxID=83374 RepID=A0A9C7PYZ9_9RHOD|nr:hypothetical protein GpartN1_g3893.t1 [Galdieria partita]